MMRYPNKSHRKIIEIPEESEELAEFLGIVFGDGGINNNWQLCITLNTISDKSYSLHVINLIKRLFNTNSAVRKRPKSNALVIVVSSTNLLNFLVTKGAVRGNKIAQKIDMPKWIKGNPKYKRAFIRGLVDTDGCIYIHNHKVQGNRYKNIGLCFTSYSTSLIYSVFKTLSETGIKAHLADKDRRIYIYSFKSVVKYLDTFRSSNARIVEKYDTWRGVRVV